MYKGKQFYLALVLAFLLGNYQGYIALWRGNTRKPDVVFPYRISSLPPEDQKALRQGIRADSETQLQHLLEDFLS